jgi:hypothetical protein|eukprot:COSAG02_NODE_1668_length_11402_cov_21.101743_3_plen_59_part_00
MGFIALDALRDTSCRRNSGGLQLQRTLYIPQQFSAALRALSNGRLKMHVRTKRRWQRR